MKRLMDCRKKTITDVPITLDGKEMWIVLSEEGEKKMEEMAKRHPGMTPQQLLDEMVKEKKAQNK